MSSRIHFFRTKLLLSFLVCSLVPLMLCSVLLVQITGLRLNRQSQQELHHRLTNVTEAFDVISRGLDHAAEALSDDKTVCKAMNGHDVEETAVNARLFQATEAFRGYASASLYDLNGLRVYSTENNILPPALPTDWGILHAAREAEGGPVFRTPGQEEILLQGAVELRRPEGTPSGYLVLEMGPEDFSSLLQGRLDLQDSLLVVNRFWRPVYATSDVLLTTSAPRFRSRLFAGEQPEQASFLYDISQHPATGLYLVLQQPRAFNRSTTNLMYAVSLSCSLLCVVMAVLLYIPMSKQISAPVQQLKKAFGRLGEDDLEVRVPDQSQDELGDLARSFNRTVKALKQNRQELLQNQKELNEAQIRLLQTQLNPHFLCNTLDTMKWISKIHQVPEVAEMSADLADILRYCISPEEFVPLYREMDFLQRYVEIQKCRMGDKFRFEVDLPEELGVCIVPKMIVQPLVENAILHGLSETADSIIRITVRTAGPWLRITVTDNGCGLPPELVGKHYTRPPKSEGHHLGLYNVDTILSKHYGSGSGLYLDRGPDGVGTAVIATLPDSREETKS